MSVNFVFNVMQRKIRPLHPGSIVIDILEDRGINIRDLYLYNLELDEILKGERPITYYWVKEIENKLGIPVQLLINLQRKVDIWDSLSE